MKKIILFILFVLFSTNAFSIIYPITPKYVSLKKNIVNLRWNASLDAPIHFIYQKKGLPVLIINEHGNWKKIRDVVGTDGWIHKSIVNKDVVGRIVKCENHYCLVKIKGYKGWLEKEFLWGIKKN